MRRSRRDHSDDADTDADTNADADVGVRDKSPRCHIDRIASVKMMLFRTSRGRPTTSIVTNYFYTAKGSDDISFNIPQETTIRTVKRCKDLSVVGKRLLRT
jgi:hypothetical protein